MAGPWVSSRSATSWFSLVEISRINLATFRTQSCGAWDMLKRKTLTPRAISSVRAAGVAVAGPRVAMIFVRRIGESSELVKRGFLTKQGSCLSGVDETYGTNRTYATDTTGSIDSPIGLI